MESQQNRIELVTRPGPSQGDGAVYYSIKSINTDATVFEMDAVTGEITFGLPARADLVQDGQFSIVVRATDGGKDPGPLHTDIQVSILMFIFTSKILGHFSEIKKR